MSQNIKTVRAQMVVPIGVCPTKHLTDKVPYRGQIIIVPQRWDETHGFRFCPDCGAELSSSTNNTETQ